jgi:UDP-glucose 4-epimerase
LESVFSNYTIEGVLHFAAKKAVGESCLDPWLYYEENIA